MSDFDRKTIQKPLFLNYLRSFNKSYQRKLNKSANHMRSKKNLEKMLSHNKNIFLLSVESKFSRKYAQKVIWHKNYTLKMNINILKQQNSSLKAKSWNIEKQNRKMDKQIDSWNLTQIFLNNHNRKKPYIDTLTVLKVLDDQDYKIVSLKIEISRLENQLNNRSMQIDALQNNENHIDKYDTYITHQTNEHKQNLYHIIGFSSEQLNKKSEQQENRINEIECEKQMMIKNINTKKKINENLIEKIEMLDRDHHNYGEDVTEEQIQKLKQQTRKIKLQERDKYKQMRKELNKITKQRSIQQCELQEKMGEYIKKKIVLKKQLAKMAEKIQGELKEKLDPEYYEKQILPSISKFLN